MRKPWRSGLVFDKIEAATLRMTLTNRFPKFEFYSCYKDGAWYVATLSSHAGDRHLDFDFVSRSVIGHPAQVN